MAWFGNETHRRKITIEKEYISGSHTNFPALIKVSGLSDVANNGIDIVFTEDDEETRIHCEIDTFAQGTGNVWVRVPSISDDADTDIYIYYGDGLDHTDDAGFLPSGTWDNNFVAVYHMNDVTTTTTKESSRWNNTGKKRFSDKPYMNNKFIGSSQFFKQIDNTVVSSQHLSAYTTITGQVTMEAKVNWSDIADTYGYILTRTTDNSLSNFGFYIGGTSYTNRIRIYFNTDGSAGGSSGDVKTIDTDYSIAITYQSGAGNLINGGPAKYGLVKEHIDGKLTRTLADGSWHGNLKTDDRCITIGNRDDTARAFSGSIDEVRISDIVRSPGWIKTCWSSQNYNSLFRTYSAEEDKPAGGTTTFNTPVGSATGWKWKTATFDTDASMRSTSGDGTAWKWEILTDSASHYVPSGSATEWSWSLENV